MNPRPSICLLVICALALTACGRDAGSTGPTYAVRDSAGIEIVENTAPAWRAGEAWRLAEAPSLAIGVLEGAPEYQLEQVVGALRLADGRVVIADGGSQQLRIYDADGRFVRAHGGQGGGPGEFEGLGWIGRGGGEGTLLTYDYRSRRLSTFDVERGFTESVMLGVESGFPVFPAGQFDDGSLFAPVGRSFIAGRGEVKGGLTRDPMVYVRYSLAGELLDTVATTAGTEYFVQTIDRGFTVSSALLGRSAVSTVSGDHVFLGTNDSYEIGRYTSDGTLLRLIRRAQPLRPVDGAMWEALKREGIEGISDENWRRTRERMFAEMPRPATVPAYENAMADAEGNLWVRGYTVLKEEPVFWTVFDTDGRMLGDVAVPRRFRVTEIGADHVLGVARDDFDVEQVQLFALMKAAG
jgi:hypothetical protein